MRKKAVALATMAIAGTVLVHPTAAFAGAYSPETACSKESGSGGWTRSQDGHRAVKSGGSTWGHVYLMWNGRLKKNCVAVIKTAFAGTPTYTQAVLTVEGRGTYRDPSRLTSKKYKYFAAAVGNGNDRCVKYEGYTADTRLDYTLASAKRSYWGNCS
ncbi:hypothetical protein [Nonomuraea candida]|uniref:hypothetical protein n=1 Tax=Nonomuraea candida TaxID=359159 RepID=UPI0005B780D4|nr:hypothetical protein [Nonomuraea candida]